MDNEISTFQVVRSYLIMATTGAVLGFVSRIVLVGGQSNTQILPSFFGFIAILCIGGGFLGMLKCWRKPWPNAGILFGLSGAMSVGGVMWVIPLPF